MGSLDRDIVKQKGIKVGSREERENKGVRRSHEFFIYLLTKPEDKLGLVFHFSSFIQPDVVFVLDFLLVVGVILFALLEPIRDVSVSIALFSS